MDDYYLYWRKIERAFYIELEKYNEKISDDRARLLLEALAIDNGRENAREVLSIRMNRSNHYHFISIGLDFKLYQARRELAIFMLYTPIDERMIFLTHMIDYDVNVNVQKQALLALLSIASRESEELMLKALDHTDHFIRCVALKGLNEMGSVHLVNVKNELRDDPSGCIQDQLKKVILD